MYGDTIVQRALELIKGEPYSGCVGQQSIELQYNYTILINLEYQDGEPNVLLVRNCFTHESVVYFVHTNTIVGNAHIKNEQLVQENLKKVVSEVDLIMKKESLIK